MAVPIVLDDRSNPTVLDGATRTKVHRRFASGQSTLRPGPRKRVRVQPNAVTNPRRQGASRANVSGRAHAAIACGFREAAVAVRRSDTPGRRGSMALAI